VLVAMKQPRQAGLTMIELAITIAVLVLLATLALPSFNARIERQRLAGAAQALAADLSDARFEAVRRGRPLHVEPTQISGAWCWSVATEPGCSCTQTQTQPQACLLRAVQSGSYAGIAMASGRAVRLDPTGTSETQTIAVFSSARGERLRVDTQALGRVNICSVEGVDSRYPRC